MLAVFHHVQPGGQVVATCAAYPNWVLLSSSLKESRKLAEPSLLDHIAATTTFAHYEIPPANTPLQGAAA